MSVLPTISGVLVLVAALGYAVATVFMKMAATSQSYPAFVIIALALTAAVIAEVVILQRLSLGIAYIAILATETLIILGFSTLIGEGLAPREMAGAALVLLGTIILIA